MIKKISNYPFGLVILLSLLFPSYLTYGKSSKEIDSLKLSLKSNLSTEVRINNIAQLIDCYGKIGRNDSLDFYADCALRAIDHSKLPNKSNLIVQIHSRLAKYGKFTQGNTYRITHRKKAAVLYRELNDKDQYAYSMLFLSNDFNEIGQIDSAIFYLNRIENYLSNDSLSVNFARIHTMKGNILRQHGQNRNAIESYNKALKIILVQAETKSKAFQLAMISNNIASCYVELEDYNNSLKYSLEALKLSESDNNHLSFKTTILNNVGVAHLHMGNKAKAYAIFKQIIAQKGNIPNMSIQICTYNNLASTTTNAMDALRYLETAEKLSHRFKSRYYLINTYNIKSNILLDKGDFNNAKKYIDLAIYESKLNSDTVNIIKNKTLLIDYYYRIQNPKKVIAISKEILSIALSKGCLYDGNYILELLIDIAKQTNDIILLDDTYKKKQAISDSIEQVNNVMVFKELETKYETEKKEKEIELLRVEDERNKLEITKSKQLNYAMMSGLGLFLLILIPSALFLRQKQKSNLLIERIAAEEAESSRIAKELHDGIASQLSYVYSYIYKQGENNELAQVVKHARDDVRAISHKLNIGTLSELSFKEALYDGLNLAHWDTDIKVKIALKPNNMDIADENVKRNTIRIIQELMANSLKHSQASEVSLQLIQRNAHINLSYQDNGIGFDMGKVIKGHGFQNIDDRVKSISGTIEYQSAPNEGVKVDIMI